MIKDLFIKNRPFRRIPPKTEGMEINPERAKKANSATNKTAQSDQNRIWNAAGEWMEARRKAEAASQPTPE